MKRMLITVFLVLFCLSTVTFAASESTNSLSKLYTVKGTGKYSGYTILKGHPDEKKFQIYFKDNTKKNILSFKVEVGDLRKINLDAVIKWKYNGKVYSTKRKDLYKYFVDVTAFKSKFNINGSTVLSTDWMIKIFGNVYMEWAEGYYFVEEASNLVGKYLMKIHKLEVPDNVTLKPDTEITPVEKPKQEPSINDIISAINDNNKKNMPAELQEFDKKWIGEHELYDSFKIKIFRMIDSIRFYNESDDKLVYEILNVPSELDSENVYTSDGINYQYAEKKFTGDGGRIYNVTGLYFSRDDLKNKKIIQ